MADATAKPAAASGSATEQLNPDQVPPAEKPLKITKRKSERGQRRVVSWRIDTIDNENLNRMSSKCCCIYVKPTKFGEDSEDDEEEGDCENCRGHFPKGRKFHKEGQECNPPAANVFPSQEKLQIEPRQPRPLSPGLRRPP
ncbi:E3 ubiquitin-protein ligase PPP1R11-like [Rhipicephalus microplus]|uniref:E3 ubiquitin-protein ligase PPP1R11-like n=1 Tax=Rhipicephalus microplus TaxID=6941 RepID=UPI003F6AC066